MLGGTTGICDIIEAIGQEKFKRAIMQMDRLHLTPLHVASAQGHTDTIEILLKTLDPQTKSKLMLKMDVCGRTPLHLACLCGHPQAALTMLNQLDDRTVNQIILTKDHNGNYPFALVDKSFTESFLSIALEQKKLWNLKSVKWLITILSQRNRFGMSAFDYEELVKKNEELFGLYSDEFLRDDNSLSTAFQEFTQHLDQIHSLDYRIPYNDIQSAHPLAVIAQSMKLGLIRHPFIQMYVDICWDMFTSKIFYLNVSIHMMFFIFLMMFVSHYQFSFTQPQMFTYSLMSTRNITTSFKEKDLQNGTEGDLYFKTSNNAFTEVFRFGMVIFALLGVIFRVYEIIKTNICLRKDTKGRKVIKNYMVENIKMTDRYIDILVLITSIVIGITSLIGDYSKWTHNVGCILIICTAFQCLSLLKHAPWVGQQCRMLIVIIRRIILFFPVLAFLVVTFAVLFYNLCQNKEQFSHIGLSMVKVVAMTVGELDYADLFFNEKDKHNFEIVSFLIFVIFVAVMTIAITNLLISVAVGDIAELRNLEKQLSFISKVELILRYSLVFSGMGIIHDRYLKEFKHWERYAVNQSKLSQLEAIYSKISSNDPPVANEETRIEGSCNCSYVDTERIEENHYIQPTYI